MNAADKLALKPGGKTRIQVTRMGFGGAALGNLYRRISDDDAQAALQAAFDLGIRHFDTAPNYGYGRSEDRFGRFIAETKPDQIVLATKVGRVLQDCAPQDVTPGPFVDTPQKRVIFDYSYDGVMRSFEESKARLGIERVDILHIHDVCASTHGSQEASDAAVRQLFDKGGYRALTELRGAGEISALGAGVNEWQVCERLLGLGDFDCFLLAGRYTLLEQEALDSFLPLCVHRDVGIILGGPYNSGILATGAVPDARYNYERAPEHILSRVRRIEDICVAHDTPLIAAALQFVFGHPAVRSVIPGAASADEVRANAALLDHSIPAALWDDLREAGLIRSDAPIPDGR